MSPSGSHDEVLPVIRVGILEIQGAFLEHRVSLTKAARQRADKMELEIFEVRNKGQITDDLDGLIMPGGESTAMSLFLKRNDMVEPLRDWVQKECHVTWGTCAGMILLSKVTENQKRGGQVSLGILDTDVSRNYFGRQIHSFEADVTLTDQTLRECAGTKTCHGIFLRAPAVVETLNPAVQVLATVHKPGTSNDVIVAVRQGNVVTTAFHPELTDNLLWHSYFLDMILNQKLQSSCS